MVSSMKTTPRDRVDSIIDHFWKNGYLTISRKYGTYLPSPKPVGNFDIDALGKFKKTYVFGVALTEKDLDDPRIIERINYLSSQNTKYSNRKVKLYLGIPKQFSSRLRDIVSNLPKENSQNIRVILTK